MRSSEERTGGTEVTSRQPDIGMQVVRSIFDGLGVDDDCCIWTERGFVWWPHRSSQRVWAEPPEIHGSGDTTWLLHAEAECAEVTHGFAESMRSLDAQLSDFSQRLSLTAIYRDDDRVVLHATAVLHEGNVDWVRRVFQLVVLSQARVALKAGTILSAVYGLTPVESEHPTSGRQTEPDEVLGALNHPPPVSQDWSYAEFGRAAEYLTGAGVFSMGDVAGLTAEFPLTPGDAPLAFGGATNLLTAEAEEIECGWQLRLTLLLHEWPLDEDGVQYLPVDLNAMEAAGESGSHLIGSWAADGDDPAAPPFFISILPPVLFEPGLLTNLALAMGVRSRWVSQYIEATVGFGGGPAPDLNDEAFRAGFLQFLKEHLDVGEVEHTESDMRIDVLIQQLAQRIRALGPETITSVIITSTGRESWVSGVWTRVTAQDGEDEYDDIADVEVDWNIKDLRPIVTELLALIGGSFAVHFHADGTATRGIVL